MTKRDRILAVRRFIKYDLENRLRTREGKNFGEDEDIDYVDTGFHLVEGYGELFFWVTHNEDGGPTRRAYSVQIREVDVADQQEAA